MSRFKDSWGKAKILLSQLLCIGAMFTACTDDEVINQTTKALQVSVSTEAPAESRAIIDGGYLPDGASIGVTLTAEDGLAYDGQAFTNLQYTAAGEGSSQIWSSATLASLSITAGKVIAYYPYYGGEDFDLKAVPVETASQTDYMYAKPVTGINMVSPAANLTMQHAMTDIRINVKKGTYTGTGEVTKITAKAPAFATTATMDVETGVFANVSGGGAQFVQELAGAAISSGNVVHDFLIVPDAKSTSGDVAIFVIIDGKKFAVTVPYTEAFQQGFAYTYNLTLDNAALTLDGVSVSKWGVKAEIDESLQFYDDQYIVEIQVPSDNYTYVHNIEDFVGTIDWGDGTISEYSSSILNPAHTYTSTGNYNIIAEGKLKQISSNHNRTAPRPSKIITKLVRIGKVMGVTSMTQAFYDQKLFTEINPGALDGCSEVTSFYGAFCNTGITEIPGGLFDHCTKVTDFSDIFYGTKIAAIPEGLFDKCSEVEKFYNTFSNCYKIKSIPEGLFDKCTKVKNFGSAFENTGITSIPEGLFDKCTEVSSFSETFYMCDELIKIPQGLFDNNTKVTSFSATFKGCASLTEIPEGLFDKCTEVTDFSGAFMGKNIYGYKIKMNIKNIPKGLFDKCTEVTTFKETFYSCESLQAIPEGLFDKNTKVTSFQGTFTDCINLESIPNGLFDNNTKVTSFNSTFRGCGNITVIPVRLFDNNTEVTDFGYVFYGSNTNGFDVNMKIINIPEGLFDNNTKVTNFASIFEGCKSLQTIPEGLFDYNTEVTNFYRTFSQCKSLTSIPSGLFDKNTKVTNFSYVFYQCESLISIPVGLFDNNTKVTNFRSMFDACKKLKEIPEGLFDKCTEVTDFSFTFSGCTSLEYIPEGLFDNNTKVTTFGSTFSMCGNLTGESPYTVININGVDTKVHLYERANYPEYFTAPTSYSSCFYNSSKLIDYSSIPSGWK